jgi:hypothetical protein
MPGAFQGGRKQIPARPGTGGQFSPSAAVNDLGVGDDTIKRTQAELELAAKRKKVLGGSASPMGSAAVMSLTGNQY